MKFDPKDMTAEQHKKFGEAFMKVYLKHGFGVLGKRDLDCLIFACLYMLTDEKDDQSNYSWARELKITPTKVKGLKLEAYLKYNEEIIQSDVNALLVKYLGGVGKIKLPNITRSDVSLSDIKVVLVAEDPVIKLEIDRCAKSLHRQVEYGNNNENLYVDCVTFMLLVNDLAGLGEDEAIRAIASAGLVQKRAFDSIQDEVDGQAWAQLSEGGKTLKFIELLGNTFAKKPMKLIGQLKTIVTSQKYQE